MVLPMISPLEILEQMKIILLSLDLFQTISESGKEHSFVFVFVFVLNDILITHVMPQQNVQPFVKMWLNCVTEPSWDPHT